MTNECRDCGARLAQTATLCDYCGSTHNDSDLQLLRELVNIKREAALAMARGVVLPLKSLLANDYKYVQSDCDQRAEFTKRHFLESSRPRNLFLSYAISDEELLDRTDDYAKMRCIETETFSHELCPNMFWRTETTFVRREERWQILFDNQAAIDENGKVVE